MAQQPTIPVKLNTGEIVQVIVCWTAARVTQTMAYYPEGYIPEDPYQMRDPNASFAECLWLQNTARRIAKQPPVLPRAQPWDPAANQV